MSDSPHRSFEKITLSDLAELEALATKRMQEMLADGETGQHYSLSDSSLLLTALVQGAAQHYVYGDRGVCDWDVVFFFKKASKAFNPRIRVATDYANSKFGSAPDEPNYKGRRVDVMGRSIDLVGTVEETVQNYLRSSYPGSSPHFWSERPVIALMPNLGKIIWLPEWKDLNTARPDGHAR